jgi:protein arginine kinase activator
MQGTAMGKIKFCTRCGFTWDEFLTRGVLGCPECYSVFDQELRPWLAEYHNTLKHNAFLKSTGGTQANTEIIEKLARLREQLSDAVRLEKFEEAIKIKKCIRELEKNGD